MCGISGIVNRNRRPIEKQLAERINDVIAHRGPDNGSVKIFDHVSLGHRRLSIIDLSQEANQPMSTETGRYTIVFNGEVYNFKEIRQQLQEKGIEFRNHSDTEVVLYAYQEYGIDCFKMFNGMFAFAIYDSLKDEVILARDQYGIKPLYFLQTKEVFIFGSEIKCILEYPKYKKQIDKQALSEYIWFGNPLGDNTIYQGISELAAGSYMIITADSYKAVKYFDVNQIKPIATTESQAIKEIRKLLDNSIERHLISDVPVGVFLSGGIDSSAITAIASRIYGGTLKTYSAGFDFKKGPNELGIASGIAKKFNTDHEEIQISGSNIINVIEKLVHSHDEPFGDAADIPLYLMTEKLEGKIKVILQGDGGDEFFGGYSRYNTLQQMKKWSLLAPALPLISLSGTQNTKFLRIQRFIAAISEKDPATRNALLLTMESKYSNPLRVFVKDYQRLLENVNPFNRYTEVYNNYDKGIIDDIQALFYTDTQIILKDTFFEKVDKSTMANSIEVRVPFLDKELTEYMLSLPGSLKTKNGVQKYLLKKALEGIVPNEILYGKKTGFSVPYEYWLQSSLKEYFLQSISTKQVGDVLDQKEVLRMFNLHCQNKGNFGFLLWKTLIFSVWLNKNYN